MHEQTEALGFLHGAGKSAFIRLSQKHLKENKAPQRKTARLGLAVDPTLPSMMGLHTHQYVTY